MALKDETKAQLDDQWRSAGDIHRRVGQWALTTVRLHLGKMRRRGEIEARQVANHPSPTYEFRAKKGRSEDGVKGAAAKSREETPKEGNGISTACRTITAKDVTCKPH